MSVFLTVISCNNIVCSICTFHSQYLWSIPAVITSTQNSIAFTMIIVYYEGALCPYCSVSLFSWSLPGTDIYTWTAQIFRGTNLSHHQSKNTFQYVNNLVYLKYQNIVQTINNNPLDKILYFNKNIFIQDHYARIV